MNSQAPWESGYYRILSIADRPLTAEDEPNLNDLAQGMTDAGPWDSRDLPAGYTYFGQFVDHDLTFNNSPLDLRPSTDLKELSNLRSPFLDLDHVYGDGPESGRSTQLYYGDAGAERFRIGLTSASDALGLPGGTPDDVPFCGDVPMIGDRFDLRNTENLILRQLHVIFLKFHNAVLAKLPEHQNEQGLPPNAENLFAQAKRLVIWVYQYAVWHDFVMTVTNNRAQQLRINEACRTEPFHLPVEFALAAFRFGHSMVRDSYPFNPYHDSSIKTHSDVSLRQLVNPEGKNAAPLEAEFVLEWDRFFPLADGHATAKARKIDTHIADGLLALPTKTLRLFSQPQRSESETQNLPLRTLLRAARAQIASGQQARQDGDFDLSKALAGDKLLKEVGLTDNTPLWYYILKEAEVCHQGEKLGDVGSRVVSYTVEKALQHDPESFLNQQGLDWRPPTWIIPVNYRSQISQLIEFVQAANSEGTA